MPAEETTTTEAPVVETAPETAAPGVASADTAQERLAAAYAIESGMLSNEDAGDGEAGDQGAEPVESTEESPAELVEPAAGVPKSIAELTEIAKKRTAEREAREAERAQSTEIETLRAQVEELSKRPAAEAKAAGVDPAMLKSDPLGALEAAGLNPREILKAMSQGVLNPGVPQLQNKIEPKLSSLETRLKAIEDAKASAPEVEAEARRESARAAFGRLTGDVERWPAVARLPESVRVSWAWDLAVKSATQGADGSPAATLSDEQIADLMQAELAGKAPTTTVAVEATTEAASSGDAGSTRNGGPKSITNDLAAPSARRRPLTDEERLAKARHQFLTGD